MKTAWLVPMVGLSGVLLTHAAAQADFIGITWEEDTFGLDHVTPLDEIPGYAGYRVINVYAACDHPDDRVVGVVGSPTDPFQVFTAGGSGFVNSIVANNKAPLFGNIDDLPSLNYDSFYSIGLFTSGPGSPDGPGNLADQVIVAPGTPPPNTDPWPLLPSQMTNMAWTVPPSIHGGKTPPAQAVAGNFPNNQVLIMRLVVAAGEDITGTFGVLFVAFPGNGAELAGSFTTIPAPGALPLLVLAGLGATRRGRRPYSRRGPD